MNKSKLKRFFESSVSEDGKPASEHITAVPFLTPMCDGRLAYFVLGFPDPDDMDQVMYQVMQLAIDLYEHFSCPIHCLLIVDDIERIFYLAEADMPQHQSMFGPDKILFQIYNAAYVKDNLEKKMHQEQWLYNLEAFIYAYAVGITSQLVNVLTNRQLDFLNDDWENFFFDEAKLKKIGHFLFLEERNYN